VNSTSVQVTRLLPVAIDRVFDAWSRAELIARWFVVDPTWSCRATNDFRVGGAYRIEMDRGDGTIFVAFGEYLEIERPHRLSFTWSSAIPPIRGSVVRIDLMSVGAATELRLTHERLPDTDEGRAHTIGWEGSLTNLERYLTLNAPA
jgi:uncharacterized protein YndB with AHSA1/START domain